MRPRSIPIVLLLAAIAVAACTGGANPSREPVSTTQPGASAKEALLIRFGDLAYCDPDLYPLARGDEAAAARGHLDEMRADRDAWTAIAGRVGFDPATAPAGDTLLTAYRQWKMLRAIQLVPGTDGAQFDQVFIGKGQALTRVTGTLGSDGSIVVASQEPGRHPACPICLARGTRIATPAGDVPVEALRPGDAVWTLDRAGRRVAAAVTEIGSTPVPSSHRVVDLVLADGRWVHVSPGHPLPDGRPVGSLEPDAAVDGSVVVSAALEAYDGGRTFDLLPAGSTGVYWANGIPLESTLVR
jgi:hypothetical protein